MVSHRSFGAQLASEESSSNAPKGSKEKKASKAGKMTRAEIAAKVRVRVKGEGEG